MFDFRKKSLVLGIGLGDPFALDPVEARRGCFAFDSANFDVGASSKGGAPNIARYQSSDSLATIEADAYFDGTLVASNLKTGDMLVVDSTAATGGGLKLYRVTITAATNDVALSTGTAIS